MKRVLIGVIAVIVIAAAGFFGVNGYAQNRAVREVEAVFEQLRGSGAKVSHGKIAFDLWTRTLTVADITGESVSAPPVTVKIGRVVATGISQLDAGRVSIASIESSDTEIGAQVAPPSSFHAIYKMPKMIVKDYTGPAHGEPLPAGASPLQIYGVLLKQFAAISASSMSAPSVTGTIDFGNAAIGRGEFTYAGVAFDGIKDGRIASEKIADVSFKLDVQQRGLAQNQGQTMTGHLVDIACSDIDT
ncbi:MAG TPA: hypothetical protein VFR21_30935, partial [Bradyrhizobium sp.]|nr:hypothetical protein [Bradyrhizobium sp.]